MRKKKDSAVFMGEMLRLLRESRNLSIKDFAELTNQNVSTISKIENGYWNFTIEFLFEYLEKLNYFIFFEEKESDSDIATLMRNRWNQNHSPN